MIDVLAKSKKAVRGETVDLCCVRLVMTLYILRN
jgi:hypothetical protein